MQTSTQRTTRQQAAGGAGKPLYLDLRRSSPVIDPVTGLYFPGDTPPIVSNEA